MGLRGMNSENEVFLSVGGNIGDTVSVIREACEVLTKVSGIRELRISSLYATSPVSAVKQSDFVNAVIRLSTTLSAHDLMAQCWALEKQYGIKEPMKDGPRALDIDLLFYGTDRMDDALLTVPHPRWRERLFVIVPLSDLVDTIRVPSADGAIETIDLVALRREVEERDPDQQIRPLPVA